MFFLMFLLKDNSFSSVYEQVSKAEERRVWSKAGINNRPQVFAGIFALLLSSYSHFHVFPKFLSTVFSFKLQNLCYQSKNMTSVIQIPLIAGF